MIHSGMCTPGCSCYEKTTHCNEWDPEYATPCRCKEHLRLNWAKKVLAVERNRMREQAIHLAWSDPSWSGRYKVPYPECVLKGYEGECSCTPGGPGGCFPEPYFGDGGVWLLQETEHIRRERMKYLDLALMDERMPLYPYDYFRRGGGRTPMPHVDPSDILADEFAVLFHAELAKRTGSGGGGGGGGMKISVKLLTGKIIDVVVESSDSGFDLKRKIQDKEGILPSKMMLGFAGKEVADERMLRDFNFSTRDVINQVMIPHGCLSGCGCASGVSPPASQERRRRADSMTPLFIPSEHDLSVQPQEAQAPPPLPIGHIDGEPYPDMSMAFGLLRCPECGYNEGDVCPDHNMGGPG